MKRWITVLLAVVMVVTMTGCRGKAPERETLESEAVGEKEPEGDRETIGAIERSTYDGTSPESILEGIDTDFTETAAILEDRWFVTVDRLGDTFDSFCENKEYLDDWYALVSEEAASLYSRTSDRAADYYEMVADTFGSESGEERNLAVDTVKVVVYDDCYARFKDFVYNDLLERPKDEYYYGVLDNPDEAAEYMEWVNIHSGTYNQWARESSAFYTAWVEAENSFYMDWVEAKSGYSFDSSDEDADMEDVADEPMEEPTEESTEERLSETSVEERKAEEDASDELRTEFKEMMDGYEAFFDEYIEFMESYDSDTAGFAAILEYADMLARYAEMVEAMDELDDSEMTGAELAYYLEVTGRIYQKLAASPALY